jgi:hypothetical protein
VVLIFSRPTHVLPSPPVGLSLYGGTSSRRLVGRWVRGIRSVALFQTTLTRILLSFRRGVHSSSEVCSFVTNRRPASVRLFPNGASLAALLSPSVLTNISPQVPRYLGERLRLLPPAAAAAARAPCSAAETQIIPLFVVVQRNHLVRVHLAELRLHLAGVHLFVVTTRCINIYKAAAFAVVKFWPLGSPVWLLLASCSAFPVHFLEFIGQAAFAFCSAL